MNERKFKYGTMSPTDPSQVPMKFYTKEAAEAHANLMNSLIDSWEETSNEFWNKNHWRVKPELWTIKEL